MFWLFYLQIIKETGFLKGLYTPDEMIADNSLDKAAKIAFLDKLIAAVSKWQFDIKENILKG